MMFGRAGTSDLLKAVLLLSVVSWPTAANAGDFERMFEMDRQMRSLEAYLSDVEDPQISDVHALARDLFDIAGVSGSTQTAVRPPVTDISKVAQNAPDPKATGNAGELSLVPIELVLSQFSLQIGSNHHLELKEAQSHPDKVVLVLRSGKWSLSDIAQRLAERDQGELFKRTPNGFRATLPIVVWNDAALHLGRGDHLELATETGAFLLNAGEIKVETGSVAGSSGKNSFEDFRPFVLTGLGGRTHLAGGTFSNLGFGDRPHMRGVSFVSSPFFPRNTQALLIGNQFDKVQSIELSDVTGARIERNLVTNATGSGLRIDGSRETDVIQNVFASSSHHGLTLGARSRNILIDGNLFVGNKRAGVFAGGGVVASTLSGNLLAGNAKSGIFLTASGCVNLTGNLLYGNGHWGVVSKRSFKVSFDDNIFVRNIGPGLEIEGGLFPDDHVQVTGNDFIANQAGVTADGYTSILFTNNDFTAQRPILFAGDLVSRTVDYLSWAELPQVDSPETFHANSLKTRHRPTLGDERLSAFSVAGLADCKI